jgi:hypothetical protein
MLDEATFLHESREVRMHGRRRGEPGGVGEFAQRRTGLRHDGAVAELLHDPFAYLVCADAL